MLDLLLRGARLPGRSENREIGVRDGRIAAAEPEARQVIDLGGALVTPALVEPHIHLDAVLTVGEPRHNETGSLFEGIAIWAERVKDLTVDDVKRRVRTVLRWQLANGVQFVRSHVDVCDPELTAVRALLELREEVGDQMVLQLVAFPQQGIVSFDGGEELMRRAINMGVDVVGAIPHFELTREYGERSVKFAMALAADKGLRVDIHCDETDDDHSRFVEVMAAETIRLGMGGRVTASHTRVKELLSAGVNVCVGHDSVMDPWYPLGYGDPLQAAFVLAHYGQMSGHGELRTLIDMITFNPASALGLDGYGLLPGCRADLCAFAAPTAMDAIRLVAPRKLVLRGGKIVARTEPAHTTVVWDGREEAVDFLKPSWRM